MSLKQKTLAGVLWSGLSAWAGKVLSLLVFLVLARLLTPEAFGVVALAATIVVLMQLFLEQGFSQALIQRETVEPEHLDTAFWTSLTTAVMLTLVSWAGAGAFARAFDQPQLQPVLQALSLIFVLGALRSVHEAMLEREFKFKTLAMRSFGGLLAGSVVGVTMAVMGFGVWSLVAKHLVNEAVSTAVIWGASEWRPGRRVRARHFKDLVGFGASLFALNFINAAKNQSNYLLIPYVFGAAALGLFTIAKGLCDAVMQLVVTAGGQIALSTFSRLQDDMERFRHVFYRATQFTACIALPTFCGIAVMAPEIVASVLGARWSEATPIVQALAVGCIIDCVAFFRGHVLTAMGKPHWRLWQGLLSAALHVIGFVIAYQFGLVAVVWAYVVRRAIVLPIGQWSIYLLIRFSWSVYLRQFAPPAAASALMIAAVMGAKHQLYTWSASPLLVLLVCVPLGAVVYALSLRRIAPGVFAEVLNIIRSIASAVRAPSAKGSMGSEP